jgi:predicted acyl esterase
MRWMPTSSADWRTLRRMVAACAWARTARRGAGCARAVPGTAVALTLDLGGIGHTFLTGHRLRLSVCSSAYPETFPNPGTGEPVTTNTAQPRVARQRVFHDFAHPSWLELPVVSLPSTEA